MRDGPGIRYSGHADLSHLPPEQGALIARSLFICQKDALIPIKESKLVLVAVADPLNLARSEELRFLLHSDIEAVSPRDTILSAINECYNTEDGAASQLIANLTDKKDDGRDGEVEVYDLLDQGPSAVAHRAAVEFDPHRSYSARGF